MFLTDAVVVVDDLDEDVDEDVVVDEAPVDAVVVAAGLLDDAEETAFSLSGFCSSFLAVAEDSEDLAFCAATSSSLFKAIFWTISCISCCCFSSVDVAPSPGSGSKSFGQPQFSQVHVVDRLARRCLSSLG